MDNRLSSCGKIMYLVLVCGSHHFAIWSFSLDGGVLKRIEQFAYILAYILGQNVMVLLTATGEFFAYRHHSPLTPLA